MSIFISLTSAPSLDKIWQTPQKSEKTQLGMVPFVFCGMILDEIFYK
jgi:hypothetical protein